MKGAELRNKAVELRKGAELRHGQGYERGVATEGAELLKGRSYELLLRRTTPSNTNPLAPFRGSSPSVSPFFFAYF